jgi:hypothetical protein
MNHLKGSKKFINNVEKQTWKKCKNTLIELRWWILEPIISRLSKR